MTAYNSLVLDIDLIVVQKAEVTLSGTVTDGTNPLVRKIVGYAYPIFNSPRFTESSSVDGSWSLTLPEAPSNRHIIIAIGETGENSEIYDWVEGG